LSPLDGVNVHPAKVKNSTKSLYRMFRNSYILSDNGRRSSFRKGICS